MSPSPRAVVKSAQRWLSGVPDDDTVLLLEAPLSEARLCRGLIASLLPAASRDAALADASTDDVVRVPLVPGRADALQLRWLTVGRSIAADVPLLHRSVSKDHALLRWDRAGLLVRDQGSANGTLVGASRLEPQRAVELRVGDIVCFGAIRAEAISASSAVQRLASARWGRG